MRELSLPQTLFLIQSPATRNLFRHDTQLLMYTPYHSTIVPNPVLMKSPGSSIAACSDPSVAKLPRCVYANGATSSDAFDASPRARRSPVSYTHLTLPTKA